MIAFLVALGGGKHDGGVGGVTQVLVLHADDDEEVIELEGLVQGSTGAISVGARRGRQFTCEIEAVDKASEIRYKGASTKGVRKERGIYIDR